MNIKSVATNFINTAMGTGSEEKSVGQFTGLTLAENYVYHMLEGGQYITPFQAIEFYKIVAPVFTGIDIVANKMAIIQPHVWNRKTKQFEDEKHPGVLDLLRNPNADITQTEYFKAVGSYYLITGTNYDIATGNVNKEPSEIFVPSPENINITMSATDMFPESYQLYSNSTTRVFKRDESVKFGLRYNSNDDKQIWQMRTFNPSRDSRQRAYGMSKLNAIYFEIKQYLESNVHNLSTLQKGARISGLMNSEATLSTDQRSKLREDLNNNYASASNAGRMMLLDGGKFTFSEMSKSNKDMDFKGLKQDDRMQIFITLGIPLAYFESKNMTMNNYSESRLALYDESVLPLTDIVYQERTNFLFPRFGMDTSTLMLTYNPKEIPALQKRLTENNERVKGNTYITPDEARELDGLPAQNTEETKKIYVPSTLVVLGENPLSTPPPEGTTKSQFFELMSSHKDKDGNRIYTDAQIEEIANKYELED